MRSSIIAFAFGVWACQYLPVLPPQGWLAAATCASIVGAGLAVWKWRRGFGGPLQRRTVACLLALAAGLLWAAWRAEWRLSDELPMQWEGRDVALVGVVADLPQPLGQGVRFVLEVEGAEAPVPRRIQLSWYDREGEGATPAIRPGERWRFTVRLKRPHGFANPGGFDYEAWLLERNLRATGYVRGDPAPERLAARVPGFMTAVHRLRDAVRSRFAESLAGREYAGVLTALAVGDQRAIPAEQWEVFRNTGVGHLVAISGLHVSLVALLGGGLVGWAWRRIPPLVLRMPAKKAAALAGLACAAGYGLLAGLGIPAQRALIMLAVVAGGMMLGRELRGSRVLALALLLVLLADPWAVLSVGFWMSFGAVGVILYVLGGRRGAGSGWRAAVRMQLAITLATVPALLALFNAFSVVSPLANGVAIPLVSFLVTPLVLLAVALPFAPLLELAHWLTGLMMVWLEWLAAQPFAMWRQAAPPAVLVAAGVVGAAWLLLPRGTPARHAGLLALVPMFLWAPSRPGEGSFRATVLDVGNGMAVHLQTARRDLVYDAGPTYGPDTDAGERVLLPYLEAAGVRRLDRLVLSHDDIDHTGGAPSLLAGLPVGELMSGLRPDHRLRAGSPVPGVPCEAGMSWRWDGVDFQVLHPAADEPAPRRDNDGSCVIRVSAPGGSLLLAGDVEGAAERRLLARGEGALASTVVLVPHHGSRSSSTPAFVEAAGAAHAIFSVGNLNPFRHPHPLVWARWSDAGARNWRTDSQGALQVEVDGQGVRVAARRETAPRYWHGR